MVVDHLEVAAVEVAVAAGRGDSTTVLDTVYLSSMDEETLGRIKHIEMRVEAIYESAEKTRKYFLWTLIATVVVFVLPLLGLLFAIPSFMDSYSNALGG